MRVSLRVSVEVDPAAWAEEYGTETESRAVREDVRSYFTNHVLCAPAVSDVGLTVRVS